MFFSKLINSKDSPTIIFETFFLFFFSFSSSSWTSDLDYETIKFSRVEMKNTEDDESPLDSGSVEYIIQLHESKTGF